MPIASSSTKPVSWLCSAIEPDEPEFDWLSISDAASDELASLDAMLEEEYRAAAAEEYGSPQWRGIHDNIDRLEHARDQILEA